MNVTKERIQMAALIPNDTNDYDAISRLLDEIEALKEIFQSRFK